MLKRCGPELAELGFALYPVAMRVDVGDADKDRLALGQPSQVDTRRIVGLFGRIGTDQAAGMIKTVGGVIFDDHARIAVAARPDDGPAVGDIAELDAGRKLRPLSNAGAYMGGVPKRAACAAAGMELLIAKPPTSVPAMPRKRRRDKNRFMSAPVIIEPAC